jgi:hypothetical protein
VKNTFWVSLCYKGAHGGGLYLQDNMLFFKTDKLTLPDNMKSIGIQYEDINKVFFCAALVVFPAIAFTLKDGSVYKFIVFNRKKVLRHIKSKINFSV